MQSNCTLGTKTGSHSFKVDVSDQSQMHFSLVNIDPAKCSWSASQCMAHTKVLLTNETANDFSTEKLFSLTADKCSIIQMSCL